MSKFEVPYTPSSEEGFEKTVSKLWELLRRNPRYRHLLRQSSTRFQIPGQDSFCRIPPPKKEGLRELYRIPILWSMNANGSNNCESWILKTKPKYLSFLVDEREELSLGSKDSVSQEIPRINESMCWRDTPEGFKEDFRKAVVGKDQSILETEAVADFDLRKVMQEYGRNYFQRKSSRQNSFRPKTHYPPNLNLNGKEKSDDCYEDQCNSFFGMLEMAKLSGIWGDELFRQLSSEETNRLRSPDEFLDLLNSDFEKNRLEPAQEIELNGFFDSDAFCKIFEYVKQTQNTLSRGVHFCLADVGPVGISPVAKKKLKRQFASFLEEVDRKAKEESSFVLGTDAEWDQFVLVEWGIPLVGGVTSSIGMASYLYPYFRKDKCFEKVGILENVVRNFDKGAGSSLGSEYCDSRQRWESHIGKAWKRFNEANENSLIQKIFLKEF